MSRIKTSKMSEKLALQREICYSITIIYWASLFFFQSGAIMWEISTCSQNVEKLVHITGFDTFINKLRLLVEVS